MPASFEGAHGRRAPNVLVGLGNEIAGDDGVGIHVARALTVRLQGRTDVEVVPLPWGGFALLDALRDRSKAGIVDCLVTGAHAPGTIVRLHQDDFRGSVRLNSFHDISFATLLSLGRRLGMDLPAEIAIWGVEAAVADEFGEVLSPAVRKAVAPLVGEMVAFVEAD